MKKQYVFPAIERLSLLADADILEGSFEVDLSNQYDEDIEAWLKYRGELPENTKEN